MEEGAGTELANKLTERLTENLREIISDNKVRAALSVILMLIVDIIAKLALLMMTHITRSLKHGGCQHKQAHFC